MGIVRQPKIEYDDADPKKRLLDQVGDLEGYHCLNNRVLVATFKRADKTKGGLILDNKEDEWQSKTGLIIAIGPMAFDDSDGKWFQGVKPKLHDWISFRPSSGREMDVHGWPCRVFEDVHIDMIVPAPDSVW
jgi:co-chaperonin GroES (HSP10)